MKRLWILAALAIGGCQGTSSSSAVTDDIILQGDYKALANCFFGKVNEGAAAKIDEASGVSTASVTLGGGSLGAGRVDFEGVSLTETRATFMVADPGKVTPLARACEVKP